MAALSAPGQDSGILAPVPGRMDFLLNSYLKAMNSGTGGSGGSRPGFRDSGACPGTFGFLIKFLFKNDEFRPWRLCRLPARIPGFWRPSQGRMDFLLKSYSKAMHSGPGCSAGSRPGFWDSGGCAGKYGFLIKVFFKNDTFRFWRLCRLRFQVLAAPPAPGPDSKMWCHTSKCRCTMPSRAISLSR